MTKFSAGFVTFQTNHDKTTVDVCIVLVRKGGDSIKRIEIIDKISLALRLLSKSSRDSVQGMPASCSWPRWEAWNS